MYSERFLNSNQVNSNSISDLDDKVKIQRFIDVIIESFYLNPSSAIVNRNDLLQARVFDHFICKRISLNEDDKGIKIYLEKIIDTAYSQKHIFDIYNNVFIINSAKIRKIIHIPLLQIPKNS